MRNLACFIIFAIALFTECGAVPFRPKRQIHDLANLDHGILPQDVDQSSEQDDRLDDGENFPFVADISEVTQSSVSNTQNFDDDAIELPDEDRDDGLRDDDTLDEHNMYSRSRDDSDHEGVENDIIHNEIHSERSGNNSNHESREFQGGSDTGEGVERRITNASQSQENNGHNRRSLGEETGDQHFLLGETGIKHILNMTETSNGRTFTIAVGREVGESLENAGNERTNEQESRNATNEVDNEFIYNTTYEHTEGLEGSNSNEHLDVGPYEGSSNLTNSHPEGMVGGFDIIDQGHGTEQTETNNENQNSNGEINGVNFQIDKGNHHRHEQGAYENLNPPPHTYNPLTVISSPAIEPTLDTRTHTIITTPSPEENNNNAPGEPFIQATTTTEGHTRNETLTHLVPENGEHEHIGETGESQIHGIDGNDNGEGSETGDRSSTSINEAPGNPNTNNENGEKLPKGSEKDNDGKNESHSYLHTQILPTPSSISPTVSTGLRQVAASLISSYSTSFEITSSGYEYLFQNETYISSMEFGSVYETQIDFSNNYYFDYYSDDNEGVYTSSTNQLQELSTIITSAPILSANSASYSIHHSDKLAVSSMAYQYPDVVPTLSSMFQSELSFTPIHGSFSEINHLDSSQIIESSSNNVEVPGTLQTTVSSTSDSSKTSVHSNEASQITTLGSSVPSTVPSTTLVPGVTRFSSSARIRSTPVTSTTSRPYSTQTHTGTRTTNKKEEYMTNSTTTTVTTRKKAHSDKDKPENSSSSTLSTSTRSSMISTPMSSHDSLHVTTTTSQKNVESTPPQTYIEIELRMGWYEFCSSKRTFISQIRSIILSEKGKTVPIEQFKLTTEYCSDASQNILSSGSITIQMYIVDDDGKIDVSLTFVTSDLIVKNFQDSNYFKDKIVSVHYHPNKVVERITNEKTYSKPSSPDLTMVIVIASVGGLCCIALIILQILIHRRVKSKKKQRQFMNHRTSIQSLDHVALGVIPKSRPGSGYWNPALDGTLEVLEPNELSHVLNFSLLANFCMNTTGIHAEFQSIPFVSLDSPSVVSDEDDKNRFANVLPYKHTRVKLKQKEDKGSDYINANYIRGYKGEKRVYIATQSPLVNTVDDFWRMIWEQQARAILMINPVTQQANPKQSTRYWPDNLETDVRREYGDFTVTLTKRDVQQDYIDCTLEIMDIERNLKREVHHFWYNCWSDSGPPEPLSFVKFVLDTRPHYENSGAPVVVHCGPGTGRTGTFIAVDICMRMFEDKRRIDILRCVHRMRRQRAGAVQSKEQYSLIYQALNEYGVILSSPSISSRSSVVTLHAML